MTDYLVYNYENSLIFKQCRSRCGRSQDVSLPRNSMVRLNDCPDKTTADQIQILPYLTGKICEMSVKFCVGA